jgi:hypothetical protein
MENNTELLQTLLVAQILILAKTIETEKKAKGSSSTDHYVGEAIQQINRERANILRRLAEAL